MVSSREEKIKEQKRYWKRNNGGNNVSFRSVLGPSTSAFSDHPSAGHSHKLLSDRNSEYYYYGSQKHPKGKSKSDKKHAILSALALLAFLFFLNILQNCIREQNFNSGTVMMFTPTGPTAPTGHQAKDSNPDFNSSENPLRKKRNADLLPKNRTESGRKSRMLLGVREVASEGKRRQVKFIRNFGSVNNWTKELSQMSTKDLDEQKLKTLNFPLYWKNNRFTSTELQSTTSPGATQSSDLRNQTVARDYRRFKKREKISTTTEPMQTENELPAATQKIWDYKKPEKFHPSSYISDLRSSTNRYHEGTQNAAWETKTNMIMNSHQTHLTTNTPTSTMFAMSHVATTPRNRRSDYNTASPGDYDDYDRYHEPTREGVLMSPTPALGLDLNTFQTFPVYNYYNHRPNSYRENETVDVVTSEPTTPEIDRIHNEIVRVTTQQPLFHPTKNSLSYSRPPHHKFRNRYPAGHGHYTVRNYYMDSKYKYSPYRKAGLYETPHFHNHGHEDYYPPVVLTKYEVEHDEPGFDLMKFLWAMVSSFARPLTKLVPGFAKDNSEEAQCYDLMVCEAQRVSRFMGPTAEALATTVGTLLTWASTEETRQTVLDAINSGRENTCQQQIRDCEERSGGKSAMTVIAQVMEMKLR